MKLKGKVAIITGSGSGIGRASAVMFAKEGAKIVVADFNEALGKESVSIIESAGNEAIFIQTDVTKASQVQNLIKATLDRFGQIDILFNNAGITHPMIPVEDLEEAVWDNNYAVNVKGIFLTVKYAVPAMKQLNNGVIINMASVVGIKPRAGSAAYSSSKAAVIQFTRQLALELAPFKIRVNCICPAMTDTPMMNQITSQSDDPDSYRKKLIENIPLGRLVRPDEIASVALFLASEEAAMITGASISIDGGRGI